MHQWSDIYYQFGIIQIEITSPIVEIREFGFNILILQSNFPKVLSKVSRLRYIEVHKFI